MNEIIKEKAAGLMLFKRALALKRRLVGRYKKIIKEARHGKADPADEIFLSEFYKIEKLLVLTLKELDGARVRLPFSDKVPRVIHVAEQIAKTAVTEEQVKTALTGTEFTLLERELALIPCLLRLALFSELEDALKAPKKDAASVKAAMIGIRAAEEVDWESVIRDVSPIETVLRENEGFNALDKRSREYCVIKAQRIARSLKVRETDAAKAAVKLAEGETGRRSHAGFFLAADGEEELRRTLSPKRPRTGIKPNAFFALFAIALIFLSLFGAGAFLKRGLLPFLLALFPSAAIALSISVTAFGFLKKPRRILRLDVKTAEGDLKTAVAVPTLLTGENTAEEAVKTLESHFLANRLEGAVFILLGDLPDAKEKRMKTDDAVIRAAKRGIEKLNNEYGERFFFLLRERERNNDGVWQGRERKRGAVTALCRMLAGEGTEFKTVYPEKELSANYLVVLDSDTVMPCGTLLEMIGAAAHPANAPVLENGDIVGGYSVFAPRMRTTARSAAKSFFTRLASCGSGYELYSPAVSNLHMDLYGEGDFGGKGILNVKAFLFFTEGKIPDNTVLSHDLLEGSLARAAFLDDVVLCDGEPDTLPKWWKRQERWIRGDWQLLPFVFGKLSRGISVINRAKMLGNMARSLREPVLFILLALGAALNSAPLMAITLAALMFEPVKGFVLLALGSIRERAAADRWLLDLIRCFIELATLPYAAAMSFTAVTTALFRTLVSHRKMLLWQTSAAAGASGKAVLFACFAAVLLLAAESAVTLFFYGVTNAFILTLFFAALFAAGPFITGLVGRDYARPEPLEYEKKLAERLFEKGWRYFAELCNDGTNHLPPDNVQEYPKKPFADLTSPTDIGMGLVALVSARDMGAVSNEEFANRAEKMLASIEKLEKWHGIPFNWYSVKKLVPIAPRFVSSVDAGNLAASLTVFGTALKEAGENELAERAFCLYRTMELERLYDSKKKLFRVGYSAEEGRFTGSCYDLYASEARVLSFVAAAEGKVPPEHWQALSRLMKDASGGRTLMSWSGTAFEYLMPLIFMETVPGSLQHEMVLSAVRTQILNAQNTELWGVSESGYYAFDRALNYQYRAFGEPALALERRHDKPRVIAPYASALALYAQPREAAENLVRLTKLGAQGKYGLYEALDFSAGGKPRIVKSFMAHHKGMELAAYAAFLKGNKNAERFMSVPVFRAFEQLLFENMPLMPIVIRAYEACVGEERTEADPEFRFEPDPDSTDCALLSNGESFAHVLSDGSGVSGVGDTPITDRDGVRVMIESAGETAEINEKPVFTAYSASFGASIGSIKAELDIFAANSKSAEVREITLVNRSNAEKRVRAGVFFRPVMAREAEFAAHPAFVKLTIDAENENGAVIFRRRKKRDREELFVYAALYADGVEYTSDAFTFPGRLTSIKDAFCERRGGSFVKRPIEPYFAAVSETALGPYESKKLLFILGSAKSRESVESDLACLRVSYAAERELAACAAGGLLFEAGMDGKTAALYGRTAARIIKRAPYGSEKHRYNGKGVRALWELGLSGDRPIVAVIADRREHIAKVASFARFVKFASRSGLDFDAVVLSRFPSEYGDPDRTALLAAAGGALCVIDRDAVGEEASSALVSMALIAAYAGELPLSFPRPKGKAVMTGIPERPKRRALELANGFGGFDLGMKEYVIQPSSRATNAPWSNIIANEVFGSLVTENGGGYSWCENSRLMRMTEWSCDPVIDPKGEGVYAVIRGVEYPLASRHSTASHGFGYTVFRCVFEGIESELTRFTDSRRPLGYFLMSFKNTGESDTFFTVSIRPEWVLGELCRKEALDFSEKYGMLTVTSSRRENDGRLAFLSGGTRTKNGFAERDMTVKKGETVSAVFAMGMDKEKNIEAYARELTEPRRAQEELIKVKALWRERLSGVSVKTGDTGFDIMVNGALLYQLYASRLFAKTGFYQSGGAVGFRDRLQDSLALLLTDPERAREIILDSSRMQFEVGDVLHWRHDNGLGVRTRISDDRLFLPFCAMEYVRVTGDEGVWDEKTPFLRAEPLSDDERERCAVFEEFFEEASLFEHCVRAIRISLETGPNGIPLMGTGDWNDGFDELGGESCFVGWFLLFVLERFAPVCERRGEAALARELTDRAKKLRESMEKTWEGDRYIRAITDDGTKLGSKENKECAIDLVSNVWAVFCEAKHARKAFDTAVRELFDEKNGVLKLLSPPFSDNAEKRAGYIESYVEGVRENGGQYTHAAAWAVIAACRLGLPETAQRLFAALNPVTRGASPAKYAVEPYVAAGDVGGFGELTGRGGWTWYTGAAGWLYTAAVTHILGIKKTGRLLKVEPVTVLDSFEARIRFGGSVYRFIASRGENAQSAEPIELTDDRAEQVIRVRYGQ